MSPWIGRLIAWSVACLPASPSSLDWRNEGAARLNELAERLEAAADDNVRSVPLPKLHKDLRGA
jgi:hypothetical protein